MFLNIIALSDFGAGVVICLEQSADLHMAQLMPLPLTVYCFSEIQIGFLPFCYLLTRVVPGRWPLNGCLCVCVCVCVSDFGCFDASCCGKLVCKGH